MTKEELIEKCITITKEFSIYNEYIDNKKPEETETQKKIERIMLAINSGFADYRPAVRDLVSAMTGLDLPVIAKGSRTDSVAFKRYACFVIMGDMHGHDYPINKFCIARHCGQHEYLCNGSRYGNNLTGCKSIIRPATENEIVDFIENNYELIISNL